MDCSLFPAGESPFSPATTPSSRQQVLPLPGRLLHYIGGARLAPPPRRPLRNPFPLMGRSGWVAAKSGFIASNRKLPPTFWIPAFAGMTELFNGLPRERAGVRNVRTSLDSTSPRRDYSLSPGRRTGSGISLLLSIPHLHAAATPSLRQRLLPLPGHRLLPFPGSGYSSFPGSEFSLSLGGRIIIPQQSTVGKMRNAAKWWIVLTEWCK